MVKMKNVASCLTHTLVCEKMCADDIVCSSLGLNELKYINLSTSWLCHNRENPSREFLQTIRAVNLMEFMAFLQFNMTSVIFTTAMPCEWPLQKYLAPSEWQRFNLDWTKSARLSLNLILVWMGCWSITGLLPILVQTGILGQGERNN
jgi:hypothetical protein